MTGQPTGLLGTRGESGLVTGLITQDLAQPVMAGSGDAVQPDEAVSAPELRVHDLSVEHPANLVDDDAEYYGELLCRCQPLGLRVLGHRLLVSGSVGELYA